MIGGYLMAEGIRFPRSRLRASIHRGSSSTGVHSSLLQFIEQFSDHFCSVQSPHSDFFMKIINSFINAWLLG